MTKIPIETQIAKPTRHMIASMAANNQTTGEGDRQQTSMGERKVQVN